MTGPRRTPHPTPSPRCPKAKGSPVVSASSTEWPRCRRSFSRASGLLSANRLGHALYSPCMRPVRPVNLARFCFLNRRQRRSTEVGRRGQHHRRHACSPKPAQPLRPWLSTSSESCHSQENLRIGGPLTTCDCTEPRQTFHHPVVGDLSLAYEVMELSADRLTLTATAPNPTAIQADWPFCQLGRTLDQATRTRRPTRQIGETPSGTINRVRDRASSRRLPCSQSSRWTHDSCSLPWSGHTCGGRTTWCRRMGAIEAMSRRPCSVPSP